MPAPGFHQAFHSVRPVRPDRALLASLRARIARIGGPVWGGWREACRSVSPRRRGFAGRGLPRACLHEIVAADAGAAAAGLRRGVACPSRRRRRQRHLVPPRFRTAWREPLWARSSPPSASICAGCCLVRVRRDIDMLWAMEEGLRGGAVAAVFGEAAAVPPIALRRLQLAAETGRRDRPLLRPSGRRLCRLGDFPLAGGFRTEGLTLPLARVIPSLSHWRESWGEGSSPLLPIRWRAASCCAAVGRRPAGWLVDWCYETHRLRVVAELRDRPAAWPRRIPTGAPPSEAGGPPSRGKRWRPPPPARAGCASWPVDAAARALGIRPGRRWPTPVHCSPTLVVRAGRSPRRAASARGHRRLVLPLHAVGGDRPRCQSPGRIRRWRRSVARRERLRASVRRRGDDVARSAHSPSRFSALRQRRRSPRPPEPPGRSPASEVRGSLWLPGARRRWRWSRCWCEDCACRRRSPRRCAAWDCAASAICCRCHVLLLPRVSGIFCSAASTRRLGRLDEPLAPRLPPPAIPRPPRLRRADRPDRRRCAGPPASTR